MCIFSIFSKNKKYPKKHQIDIHNIDSELNSNYIQFNNKKEYVELEKKILNKDKKIKEIEEENSYYLSIIKSYKQKIYRKEKHIKELKKNNQLK